MPPTYTLKGRITDAGTGAPVRNATVKIVGGTLNFGKTAYTNNQGRYKMTGIKPEKIIIEASLSYQPKSKLLTVSGPTAVNLPLTKS
jgi:protocatechuate 3,4-dioxygenase beta subunit